MNSTHPKDYLQKVKLGYVPLSGSGLHPGDRRRFCFFTRLRGLAHQSLANEINDCDVVVLSQAADTSFWSRYPRGKTKIIYDLVDSYLNLPRTDPKALLRGFAKFLTGQSARFEPSFWKSLREMCKRADAVVCTTEEQRQEILPFCKNVHLILDSHATVATTSKTDYSAGRPFKLVWEGLPQNVTTFSEISPVLKKLSARYPLELHLVTDLEFGQYMGKYVNRRTVDLITDIFQNSFVHQWEEVSCSKIISSCDLGLIPIPFQNPLAYGKPENKLLLLWRMGLPTLTAGTPAYDRAMRAAGIDMICSQLGDWEIMIQRYIESEKLRRGSGQKGKHFASHVHGEQQELARWDRLIESIL